MIREFRVESDRALPYQKVFKTEAETLRGIVRAARTVTGDSDVDAPCISPARRPGWHPLGNPYARRALGIEG